MVCSAWQLTKRHVHAPANYLCNQYELPVKDGGSRGILWFFNAPFMWAVLIMYNYIWLSRSKLLKQICAWEGDY